jgi:vitamin B12 transporter
MSGSLTRRAFAQLDEARPQIDVGPAHLDAPEPNQVLGEHQIEQSSSPTSEDVLRSVPGITVTRSGGAGQPSFVFIRGADSAGTLVLLDGFQVNDPSLNNHVFDFSTLNLENIERVEVWKGPQSVLFGSGATGGVINIITKKGHGPLTKSVGVEVGSYNTVNASAGLSGSTEHFYYSVLAGRFQTNGISAASSDLGYTERDGAWMNTVSSRLGWTPVPSFEIELVSRWTNKKADLDYAPSDTPPFFIEPDAPNYRTYGESLELGLKAKKIWNSAWSSTLSAGRFGQERSYKNDPDTTNSAWLRDSFTGESYHLENFNTWQSTHGLSLMTGPVADFEDAASQSNSDVYSSSVPRKFHSLAGWMARVQWDRSMAFLTLGDRIDHHNQFGDQNSFELSPGLHVSKDLDVFFRYATAYKAPTLYELYNSTLGNSALQPEHAAASEISLVQFLDERRSKLQFTVFQNQYKNLIDFIQSSYVNIGSAQSRGFEAQTQVAMPLVRLQLGYTYLETRDNSTGLSLLRRPRNSIQGQIDIQLRNRWNLDVEYISADHRLDIDPITSQSVIDASYQVFNATVTWQMTDSTRFYLRCLNIANLQYQEVAGYGTYPRSYYLGVRSLF